MPQWVKALVTKFDDLSLNPGTHSVEGEDCANCLLTSMCAECCVHMCTHT